MKNIETINYNITIFNYDGENLKKILQIIQIINTLKYVYKIISDKYKIKHTLLI